MAALLVTLLAIAAPVGIHVEDESGDRDSLADAQAVVEILSAAITTETGRKTAVDDSVWAKCDRKDRCLSDIRARLSTADIVFVKLFKGLTKSRVIFERMEEGQGNVRAERDLPPDRDSWAGALAGVVSALGIERPDEAQTIDLTTSPEPVAEPGVNYAPWVVAGGTVVALAVGIGFGVSSQNAKSQIDSTAFSGMQYDGLSNRATAHGVVANILFGAATVGAITSAVLFAAD